MKKARRTPPSSEKKPVAKIVVVIRKKSAWQKDECLFCPKKATKEATAQIVGDDNFLANMRCCKSSHCQEEASKLARKCCEDRLK